MTETDSQPEIETDEPVGVTAEDIAKQVATIHKRLDQFKDWSATISEWLEEERYRLKDEGELQAANETTRLIAHVESVFNRIEYGDAALRPDPEQENDNED